MTNRIEQLRDDYLQTAAAFKEARTAAADVCKAAEERMQEEQREAAEKIQTVGDAISYIESHK